MTKISDNSQSKPANSGSQATADEALVVVRDESWSLDRRRFLEAAGFSLSVAAMSGCGRAPVEKALPSPIQPPGTIPGKIQYYASTCQGCSSACGLLVGTRDGRPLKMEGLPEHPLSQGGLCAVGQALPIGLYDSHRLNGPLQEGKKSDWTTVDNEISQSLQDLQEQHQVVRFISPTITSPTLQAAIDRFLSQFEDAKHIVFDTVSNSAILDAHQETHAARVLPHYRFDRAEVIVSFGADFLGTWISPVEFTAGWSSRREPTEQHPQMSYHVQFESRMTLTGSNADQRIAIAPQQQGAILGRLAEKIAKLAGDTSVTSIAPGASADHEELLVELAQRLWQARGKSLVVCDSQEVAVQRVVNYLNHLLGNYGETLDVERPSLQRQSNDRELAELIEEIKSEQVGALFVADVDLLHDLGSDEKLTKAVGKIPLTISFAPRVDEFAGTAKFVCPDHHPLESWSDAEPISGLVSLAQPTIRPLRDTRSIVESLAAWSGEPTTAYTALQAYWQESIFPRRKQDAPDDFQKFWEQSLHDGMAEVTAQTSEVGEFAADSIQPITTPATSEDFTLVLYNKVSMPESRHAHNPWLHELPDPISKVTWGNYVCISPSDAAKAGVENGDIVKVSSGGDGPEIDLPALVQVGQHDGILAVALAYGCPGTDRFANIGPQWFEAEPSVPENEQLGKNAASFLDFREGAQQYIRSGVSLTKTGGHRQLAMTQLYNSLEMPTEVAPPGAEHREVVEHTTLGEFAEDSHAGAAEHHFDSETQLWPEDHPKSGHAWGMAIDLNKCTGCSACVIACQSENNVPVVGYDEVRRQREMHWMRIDRYYTGEENQLQVDHQPMMCQHCDNAPCETVCPALATVHSSEGLNEQVYNRCVGTRYCANNCPYKVRRFNWFKYPHDDKLQNLVLNPEVTVRSRGVMEKCSLCVQRIEAGKVDAKQSTA